MSLHFQTLDVKFNQGLDTKTQKKLTVPGKWTQLENYGVTEDGALRRRDGTISLVPSATGNGLALYNDQLLTLSGGRVKSLSTASSAVNDVPGRLGYVGISKSEIRRSTGMQDSPDCATGRGFTCYVWREKSPSNVAVGINLSLVDETTGAVLQNNIPLKVSASAFCPRVVFDGTGVFFIFYIDGTNLFCHFVDTAAPNIVSSATSIINSAHLADLNFDAIPFVGAVGEAQVLYGWTDGTTSVRTLTVKLVAAVPTVDLGPTNVFAEADLPIAALTGLAACAFSNNTAIGLFATATGATALAGLAGAVVDITLAVSAGPTQLDASAAATASSCHVTACPNDSGAFGVGAQVFWDRVSEWSTNALNPLKTVTVNSALTSTGAVTLVSSATFGAGTTARGPQGPFIAGKAFFSGSKVFLPTYVASVYNGLSPATANPRNANTQNTFFLLELVQEIGLAASMPVVAKALYGSFGLASINGAAPAVSTPCSVANPSTGVYAQVASELTQLVLASGNNVSPTGLVRLNMLPNTTQPSSHVQLGETAFIAGGSLTDFDGAVLVEHGFPLFPEGAAITVNGAGTGAMTAGVHQVVFIFEWVDNAGQRHQSAPSLPISVTTVATGSLSCFVPTLLLSQKTNIQVVAFMTEAGALTFKRVLLNNGAYAPVLNNTAATTVTLTIDDSDATIAGNEVLYTQPNLSPTALPNVAPSPCSFVWTAHRRLWFNKSDQPLWFGYSQEYINNVGLQFAPELEETLPPESGGFVGGAEMDEKVVIFGRRRIYAMYGTGPNASGSFNNYSHPQDIQADVGLMDAFSIMEEAPDGILFKSEKGFYLLGRDLSVKYVGAAVDAYNDATVTSAVLMADRQEIRFSIQNPAISSANPGGASQLIYSYLYDQWSTSTYVLDDNTRYAIVDAVWYPPLSRYVSLSLVDGLNQDTPDLFIDSPGAHNGVFAQTTARTSWLHLSKLGGFQRVRKLYLTGTAEEAPTSQLHITVDFNDSFAGPLTYIVTVPLATIAFPSLDAIDLTHKLTTMKCKSVAFTFNDEPPTFGSVPLVGLQSMALEIGVKRGTNKLPAAQNA